MSNDHDEKKLSVHIALDFTASPRRLNIDAQVENYDMALAMLDQARRWFETQLRLARVMEAQAQMRRAAEDQAIAADVRRNH